MAKMPISVLFCACGNTENRAASDNQSSICLLKSICPADACSSCGSLLSGIVSNTGTVPFNLFLLNALDHDAFCFLDLSVTPDTHRQHGIRLCLAPRQLHLQPVSLAKDARLAGRRVLGGFRRPRHIQQQLHIPLQRRRRRREHARPKHHVPQQLAAPALVPSHRFLQSHHLRRSLSMSQRQL